MARESESSQPEARYDAVKEYYGQVVRKSSDLKTSSCCASGPASARIAEALRLVNDEIKEKYYGCGSPIPLCIEGLRILDLGCGTGRDCYVMSQLAGEQGFVYGIDMTENQIAVAMKYIDEETAAFGYSKPNVEFIFDYIENIPKHFEAESLDLFTSNCVVNLTEDKEVILRRVYEALKIGGEMYFSDVYVDRRLPVEISRDPVLRGECLGGALYHRDFEAIAGKAGFADPRVCSKRPIDVKDEQIQKKVGDAKFYSITYRLWKIQGLEQTHEDYGHAATYTGQVPESPSVFELDESNVFYKGKPERICGNTALMLGKSRFKGYFQIAGDFGEHFGAFIGRSSAGQDNETGRLQCG
ncbi:MAG: methyltransferase domain-containing protein [Planctomycetota bacterium]